MKNQNLSEDDIDKLLNDLSGSARSPQGKYSAGESYPELKERLFTRKTKRFPLLRYVAAAAVILIAALSAYLIHTGGTPEIIIITTADQVKEVTLPDGTHVTLSRYSSLQYPSAFKKDSRDVVLSGEGFFDVTKDKEHPFIVQAEDVRIEVLGTQFNIESYAGDGYIKTTLIEGSVAVSNTINRDITVLEPNQSAIFCKETAILHKEENNNALDEAAWRDGKLIFNDKTLAEISNGLSNYFNVDISINDDKLKEYKLTARFEHQENLEEILTLLEAAGKFTWTRQSNQITINPK